MRDATKARGHAGSCGVRALVCVSLVCASTVGVKPDTAYVRLNPDTTYAASVQSRLTFTRDIAPIVWARCATCHRPGEIGPFNLLTYDDVKRRATQIAAVTKRRVMPPWKPEPGKGEFQNARRLTDRELQMMQDWIADGTPEGAASDLPPPPTWVTAVV